MTKRAVTVALALGALVAAAFFVIPATVASTPGVAAGTTTTGTTTKGSVIPALEYLGNPKFYNSSFDVVPGTTVSLHWSGGSVPLVKSGVHFVLTSSIPGFGSASGVSWPPKSTPAPTWNGTGWVTTATGMSVKIPQDAAPGTHYQVAIEACLASSCDVPANVASLAVPDPPTTWSMKPYSADYSKVATFPAPHASQPFAIASMPSDNSVWAAAEFSHVVMGVPGVAKKAHVVAVTSPPTAPPVFRKPFALCRGKCIPSSTSALSEDIVTSGGWIWTSFGGWRVYANGQRDLGGAKPPPGGQPRAVHSAKLPPNRSEVVAYDPTTRHFCTYLLPGNDTQVAGVAVVGQRPNLQVWAVESYGSSGRGSLVEFDPSAVGKGCDGRTDKAFVLPTSVRRLTWPDNGAQWPVQIVADPASPTLWVTDFNPYNVDGTPYSGIDRIDISDPAHPTFVKRIQYPGTNASNVFGAKPWHIVAPPNSNYVYAIDNGDARIIRIDKTTDQLQAVPIPLTSDLEDGFGLALWGDRLYFALADDYSLTFGRATAFGYLNLASWPENGAPTGGVIYTGLPHVTDPTSLANYRAVTVTPNGQVGLTNQNGLVVLKPRS